MVPSSNLINVISGFISNFTSIGNEEGVENIGKKSVNCMFC